jgi:hypothetical protein
MFEKSVLRSISRSKTEIVRGERIKQLHEEPALLAKNY